MMTETVQETDSTPKATIRQSVSIPIFGGVGQFITFNQLVDGREHIAISFTTPDAGKAPETPLVRVHSECLTGDVFGSARCDCGEQLQEAIRAIAKIGGVLLYLRQEGRGIGLYSKLDAYSLQDLGHDTFDANRLLGLEEDARDYTVAFQMLEALGIRKIRLLSNNPEKARQLESHGIEIQELVSTRTYTKLHNVKYLLAKATKGGHKIDLQALRPAGAEA